MAQQTYRTRPENNHEPIRRLTKKSMRYSARSVFSIDCLNLFLQDKHRPPTFLTLPFEIRKEIYLILFVPDLHDDNYAAIRLVQHQIRDESLPEFWKMRGPKRLKSIEEILGFATHCLPIQLETLKKINIDLGTDDMVKMAGMSPLDTNASGSLRALIQGHDQGAGTDWTTRITGVTELYHGEKEENYRRIWGWLRQEDDQQERLRKQGRLFPHMMTLLYHSLTRMTNIKEIKFSVSFSYDIGESRCPNFAPENHLLLEMLAEAMPRIHSLAYFSSQAHLHSMNPISNFRLLRKLVIEVHSSSTSKETLEVLLSLSHLEELGLSVYYPRMDHNDLHFEFLFIRNVAVTEDVIRQLRPLKTLTIKDGRTVGGLNWLCGDIVKAVNETHSASLIELNITSDDDCAVIDISVVDELLLMLPTMPKLEKVALLFRVPDDYGLVEGNLEEYMPPTVKENRSMVKWEIWN